jgi:hypothetical protein
VGTFFMVWVPVLLMVWEAGTLEFNVTVAADDPPVPIPWPPPIAVALEAEVEDDLATPIPVAVWAIAEEVIIASDSGSA